MSIVAQLVGPVTGLLDKFIEDKDQKAALAHEIATMSEKHHFEAMKGQLEVNKVEAAHKSLLSGSSEADGSAGAPASPPQTSTMRSNFFLRPVRGTYTLPWHSAGHM